MCVLFFFFWAAFRHFSSLLVALAKKRLSFFFFFFSLSYLGAERINASSTPAQLEAPSQAAFQMRSPV